MKRMLMLAVSTTLLGCATVGREISDAQLATLKKGETTTNQAAAAFGEPTSTTKMSDGRQIMSYSFAYAQARPATFIPIVGIFAGGSDVRSSVVMLTFNKDGVLQDYTSTQSVTGVGMGLAAGTYMPSERALPQEANNP
jgi:outer membrane protein assembly factor BamE (lipoprotein component of BamABCDE complex)